MKGGIRIGLAVSIVLSVAMLMALGRALRRKGDDIRAAAPASTAPTRLRLPETLRQLLIADCLIRLCEGLPEVFLVVWAIEIVRVTPAQFGVLVSVLMVTAIASYLPAAALAGRAEKKPFVILTYLFTLIRWPSSRPTASRRSRRQPSSAACERSASPRARR
jgi:hypothetical protein